MPVDLFTTEQDLPRVWISRADEDTPVGLFNWLDPAGNTVGTIMGRYLQSEATPVPRSRVVKLSDLEAALPDSPRIDFAERSDVLKRRERAAHRRNRH